MDLGESLHDDLHIEKVSEDVEGFIDRQQLTSDCLGHESLHVQSVHLVLGWTPEMEDVGLPIRVLLQVPHFSLLGLEEGR